VQKFLQGQRSHFLGSLNPSSDRFSGMKLSEATWAEIRVVHQTTREPLRSIASRFGAGYATIFQRAINEQWGPRPPLPNAKPRLLVPNPAFVPPVPVGDLKEPPRAKRKRPDAPKDRRTRVLQLIDQQLDNAEILMTVNEHLTTQDGARLSRTIRTTIASLERVDGAGISGNQALDQGQGADTGDRHLKTEKLRRDIAQRLERLNAQWNAHSKPE
jgi:hypothetical protein